MEVTQWAMSWLIVLFMFGLTLLFGGGHALVKGASGMARLLGVHPIIIGLTVVALGTSMPELLVSLDAAFKDKPDFALGNVVGSNVANIGLILGLSALARPIGIHMKLLRFEIPLVIGISVVFWLLCLDGLLGRFDGILLVSGFIVFLYVLIKGARKDIKEDKKENSVAKQNQKIVLVLFIAIGMIALKYGAQWTIDAASEISRRAGVSELVLGLTIVALGTSLPELATSVVAAFRKEADISIGNIIGSNLFNMMAIAGPTAAIHPLLVSDQLKRVDLPIMLGLTIVMFPLLYSGRQLTRLEGGFLLMSYIGIILWWTL
jgi:cation:H+ antiporter